MIRLVDDLTKQVAEVFVDSDGTPRIKIEDLPKVTTGSPLTLVLPTGSIKEHNVGILLGKVFNIKNIVLGNY